MRFALVMLAVAAVLAACSASARWLDPGDIPEEMKNNPPAGSHWNEELGIFVLDVPIPVLNPAGVSLQTLDEEIYFDNSEVIYWAPQQNDYFALVRFPTPECGGNGWLLTAVRIGVYNIGPNPDPGEVVIYDHEPDNCIGDVLGFADFVPEPYIGSGLPAQWQKVDLYPPVEIPGPEFWVALDYRPGEPGDPTQTSVYGAGHFLPGLPDEDQYRSHEVGEWPCPLNIDWPRAWLIRAMGHCDGLMTDHPVDIKPMSCPNPLGVKNKGVIPMAILGTDMFDVSEVDPTTVRLEDELVPIRWAYEDAAEPFPGELCDCWTNGPDGYADLTLKFDAPEVVEYLGDIQHGDVLELTLSWELYDGREMSGSDCMIVRAKGKGPQSYVDRIENNRFALFQNSPNPFKSGTSICFSLPEKSHTTLTVHDLSGRLVSVVADGEFTAGVHTVEWNANVPSGFYFYRIKAGELAAFLLFFD
jgi:hypothetical protein